MAPVPSGLLPHLVLVGPSVDDDVAAKMSLAGVTPALIVSLTPPGGQGENNQE